MKAMLTILLVFSLSVLMANPRGLTSREIPAGGEITVIQAQAELGSFISQPSAPQLPYGIWENTDNMSMDIVLPAHEQIGARYVSSTGRGEFFYSLGTENLEVSQAVNISPQWLRSQLRKTLLSLNPQKQHDFATMIANVEGWYIDEVAFCVAYASPEYLNSPYSNPQIFIENVQNIHAYASQLPYVEIHNEGSHLTPNYWSTVKYWRKDANGQLEQIMVPRDIYYWNVVFPKITDEISAYIDPDVVESNTTHTNNIANPPTGYFWRSYFWEFAGHGAPTLMSLLTSCQTLYNRDNSPGDAISAITSWINQNMDFTSNNERPHQPVRILTKGFGRCGEYADLTSATARTALIPCTNVSSISEDHTWNEFWESDWVAWEPVNGYLNNPLVYEDGWGKVFGCVFQERADGLFTPVTQRYSSGISTINIQVVDASGLPVDAARVVLAINNPSAVYDCEAYTDNNGMVSFVAGDNRSYLARVETSFGAYPLPAGSYAQLTTNSAHGATYNYQFELATALPLPAITVNTDIVDTVDDYRFYLNSVSSPGYLITGRSAWDDIDVLGTKPQHYTMVNQPATFAFMVTDADNQIMMQYDNNCMALYYQSPFEGTVTNFGIPIGQDWYAMIDNSHRHGNAIILQGSVNLQYYNSNEDSVVPGAQLRVVNLFPNPVKEETKLLLELGASEEVGIKIFNARGQMVRNIPKLRYPQGQSAITWDACDASGTRVSAGVYMVMVQGSGSSQIRKLVVLK